MERWTLRTKKGISTKPKQSPMRNEMHDDHDNREAANYGGWFSSPEEASHIVIDCYEWAVEPLTMKPRCS